MMKLFDITEKYGKATYAYPFEPYIVPENFRGQPEYTYELCIGCAACGIACPSNAIELKMIKARLSNTASMRWKNAAAAASR